MSKENLKNSRRLIPTAFFFAGLSKIVSFGDEDTQDSAMTLIQLLKENVVVWESLQALVAEAATRDSQL